MGIIGLIHERDRLEKENKELEENPLYVPQETSTECCSTVLVCGLLE